MMAKIIQPRLRRGLAGGGAMIGGGGKDGGGGKTAEEALPPAKRECVSITPAT